MTLGAESPRYKSTNQMKVVNYVIQNTFEGTTHKQRHPHVSTSYKDANS